MSESGRALGGLNTKSSLADASRNDVEVVKVRRSGREKMPGFEPLWRCSNDVGACLLGLFWVAGEQQTDATDLTDVRVVGVGAQGDLNSTPVPLGFNAIVTLLPEILC